MTAITYKGKKFPADAPLIIENNVAESLVIDGCENVIIRNMKFSDWGTGDVRALTNRPVQISDSKGITFTQNEISRCSIGILLTRVTDSLIDANVIHDLNEDGIRPVDCERVTITRNEMYDWYINKGKHPDALQSWNPTLGHDADSLIIEDNCIHRGKGEIAQGISVRYQNPANAKTKGWTSYTNLAVRRNLVIGLVNGLTVSGSGVCENNEIVSFADKLSKISRAGTGVALLGNIAQQYALGSFSKTAPAGNHLNTPIDPAKDPTAEAALVAAWRKRVFPVAPPVDVPPPVEPDPVPVGVSFTQEQKDAVRAALASIGAI